MSDPPIIIQHKELFGYYSYINGPWLSLKYFGGYGDDDQGKFFEKIANFFYRLKSLARFL